MQHFRSITIVIFFSFSRFFPFFVSLTTKTMKDRINHLVWLMFEQGKIPTKVFMCMKDFRLLKKEEPNPTQIFNLTIHIKFKSELYVE